MKRSQQNGKRGGGSSGRGAAAAAVGDDRAAYTDGIVDGVGGITSTAAPPPQHLHGSNDGGNTSTGGGNPANIAKAQIAITKNWTEGESDLVARVPTEGDTGDRRGARVSAEAANPDGAVESSNPIRVENEGNEGNRGRLGFLKPSTPKLQIRPSTPIYFHSIPHNRSTFKNTPQSNLHIRNQPHLTQNFSKPTLSFEKSKNTPHSFRNLTKTPQKFEFQPSVPCTTSFQPLANSSSSSIGPKNSHWIFDCGATDTMSFDASNFLEISQPTKHYVQTANGDLAHVQGAGTITISPTLCLSNCLYVPSLSHKLLSVSHVTKDLNCKLLMQPRFCMLQDIKTGTIVGRGTERHGLYYVDEIAQQSTAMLTHGLTDRQIWLLHRRLGHPSIGYLHLLFPELVSSSYVLNCETCVLAKSHRRSFKPRNT